MCFEKGVRWAELGDVHGLIPEGPVSVLVTIFHNLSRKTNV